MPVTGINFDAQKYKRFGGGIGVITACGLIIYERFKINKTLSKLLDTNVLDIDRKRPDYIYIKYHIYRESMRKLKQKQQDKNWINIIIHPIGKWWKTFKHSVAWRLLNIAQNGDKHERLKAIRQLALIDHLKDWDFRHLAQICDARTAVSLARSNCDTRWFIPVHMNGVIKNPVLVLNDLHTMLEQLKPNSCIEHFLKKYFDTSHIKDSDMDEFYLQSIHISRENVDLLKECVAFLHHLTSTDVSVCKQIVKAGGLNTLMELRKIFNKDNETLITLSKTLANISLVDDAVEDFFVTGWVGVLANWQQHADIRLQVIAAKTLTNLDHDDQYYFPYPPNVYPLYPKARRRAAPALDVVFIHGLLGGVFITWRQRDQETNELGLYGKNAFYTSESDDVFLVGENKRGSLKNGSNGNGRKNSMKVKRKESLPVPDAPVINKKKLVLSKTSGISDIATKELVETLETTAELGSDWEVVFPDCPLKANENSEGVFSVSGEKWINDDDSEEYTNCWPMDWLPEDYPNIRVIGIDYTSAVTQWSANFAKYCPCEKGHGYIDTRSTYLLEKLQKAKVGENRPVVWIGHSMGGILCKNILLKALERPEQHIRNMAKNTKGIIFLGTPHKGSSIARWKQHMQMILSPSIEVKELEENSPKLLDLHNRFMKLIKTYFRNLNVVTIAEGEPTMLTSFKFPLKVVTEESAHINYGDFFVLKDDHLSLSKPIFRQSFLYQRLLKLIDTAMNTPLDTGEIDENYNPTLSQQHSKFTLNSWNILPRFLYKFLTPIET